MSSLQGEDFSNERYNHDDKALIEAFKSTQLPVNYFQRHRNHIRLAYIYLTQTGGYDAAYQTMSADLKSYFKNKHIDSESTGYHETLTVAWLRMVNHVLKNYGSAFNSTVFCDSQPHLLHNSLMRLFYKRDTLYSAQAKTQFVQPDLLALPD